MKFCLNAKSLLGAVAVSALMLGAPIANSPIALPAFAEVPLQGLPNVADLAEKLLPAVVEISVESKMTDGASSDGPKIPDDSPFKDFFDQFLKKKQQQGQGGDKKPDDNKPGDQGGGDNSAPSPDERTVNSMGSGFIIDATGLIVTNNHVVEGANTIQVHMQDGTILKAELVGRDPKTDIAVIRVKPDKPLPVVNFGDSDKTRIGEWALAIGNPFGLGGSVSLGIR